MSDEPKYHRMHYNFVAKRLRNHYPQGGRSDYEDQIARRVIEDIALEFAGRFAADNPDFDPYQFLDQCSPNEFLYPLSELWDREEEHERSV